MADTEEKFMSDEEWMKDLDNLMNSLFQSEVSSGSSVIEPETVPAADSFISDAEEDGKDTDGNEDEAKSVDGRQARYRAEIPYKLYAAINKAFPADIPLSEKVCCILATVICPQSPQDYLSTSAVNTLKKNPQLKKEIVGKREEIRMRKDIAALKRSQRQTNYTLALLLSLITGMNKKMPGNPSGIILDSDLVETIFRRLSSQSDQLTESINLHSDLTKRK